jgi:hypothetical protein
LVISGPPTSAVLWYQHSSGISAGLSVDLPLLLNSRALDMHVAVLDCTRSSAPNGLAWHFHGVHAGTVEGHCARVMMDGKDIETMKGGDRASMSRQEEMHRQERRSSAAVGL